MRRRLAILLTVVLLVVLAGLALTWIQSDHYIVLPDKARPTDPLVEIPGEEGDADGSGIYMVDVRVGRANLLERFFPGIHEGASLLPEEVLNPQGVGVEAVGRGRGRLRHGVPVLEREQHVPLGGEEDLDGMGHRRED